jgi:hypothetical protein
MRMSWLVMPVLGLSLLGPAGAAQAAGHAASTAVARRKATVSADAGYAVTGRHLTVVETWVTLPRPGQFASEVGRIGASLQLWSARLVFDLRVAACTDATCRAGGRPTAHRYHAVLAVYSRRTHKLICSTSAPGKENCGQAGEPDRFGSEAIAPGQNITLAIVYGIPYDQIFVQAADQDYGYGLDNASLKPRLEFTQARIAVEFGVSPWSDPDLRAPAATELVMSFDRPAPPPYMAEIVNLAGHSGGLTEPWWTPVKISTGPGPARATAGTLWDDGYGLTVYLQR